MQHPSGRNTLPGCVHLPQVGPDRFRLLALQGKFARIGVQDGSQGLQGGLLDGPVCNQGVQAGQSGRLTFNVFRPLSADDYLSAGGRKVFQQRQGGRPDRQQGRQDHRSVGHFPDAQAVPFHASHLGKDLFIADGYVAVMLGNEV